MTSFEEIQQQEARLFFPVVARLPVALVRGEGVRVFDVDGREYLDLTAGWGVTSIGHCHPRLVEALREQAGRLMQTTNIVYTLPQLELCERLAALTPPEITRSFFLSSGTEAVETALKAAHRMAGRRKFVSTTSSFHGRTLGALQVIGQARHRDHYQALLPEQVVIPYDDAAAAEAAIDADTAALIVEPIQGEGGVNTPSPGYLARLRALTRERGALLIFDEIQTGVGRTGDMFALEHEGVTPDLLTLGKGLGGGFPVSAVLCTEAVAETMAVGDHGGTYAGNPLGAVAACATLDVIREEALTAHAAQLGARLRERLDAFADAHPELASGARGRGLLQGLALRDVERALALPARALREAGILVNVTGSGTLRLFPALNIEEGELLEGVARLLELVREG